jgi:hypothetical protein
MGTPNDPQQVTSSATPSAADLDGLRELVLLAKTGELYLDPEVAKVCASACDDILALLRHTYKDMRFVDHIISLGDFECGKALAQNLKDLLSGPDGFLQRLDEHQKAVTLIHDMTGAQVAALLTTDADLQTSVKKVAN